MVDVVVFFVVDVLITVEDGKLGASRALLCQRSHFMSAMLNGGFEESGRQELTLPDMDVVTLRHCLHFLYLDQCPRPADIYDSVELIAIADRFCLPRLIDLVQEHITNKYLTLPTSRSTDQLAEGRVAQYVLEVLEPAEVL